MHENVSLPDSNFKRQKYSLATAKKIYRKNRAYLQVCEH